MATMEAERMVYDKALKGMFALAALTVVSTALITAPYGRHSRSGWGPSIGGRLGWCLMESPTLWLSALLFPLGRSANPTSLLLLVPFLLHYIQRTLIYPLFRVPSPAKPIPLTIVAAALFFNCYNTFLQVRWVSHFGVYTTAWLWSPAFILGLGVFLIGMYINIWADSVLFSLRKSKEGGDGSYQIPRGGIYEYVSCPNYLGEIVEWMGWAIMTWSWPGLAFFVYTASNLGPRAVSNHAWYLKKFPRDYPKSRKALVPYVY
ncbi:hypothetical protein SUGI_0257970 [Cryptomeria japonica]|uniref:steroid 5-alpha-reductase DET2 n=1 Tax=Cryptomeria japonica TaxID=3369 RepID=UPI002408E149|nr:steroid 5-alpha-reductase DET2 [Cryptomeria japonica]GLJ15684.1 hypothetical protein SUGI_0257970 [Cryptomeria japonica]